MSETKNQYIAVAVTNLKEREKYIYFLNYSLNKDEIEKLAKIIKLMDHEYYEDSEAIVYSLDEKRLFDEHDVNIILSLNDIINNHYCDNRKSDKIFDTSNIVKVFANEIIPQEINKEIAWKLEHQLFNFFQKLFHEEDY